MIGLTALKVQGVLSDLVNHAEREKLSVDSLQEFHQRLKKYFISVGNSVLEYTRDTIETMFGGSLPLIWKMSEESPFDLVYVSTERDGRAYFAYRTRTTWSEPSKNSDEVCIKHFAPHTEFAFVRDNCLYVARGKINNGKLPVYREEVYLPRDITGLF